MPPKTKKQPARKRKYRPKVRFPRSLGMQIHYFKVRTGTCTGGTSQTAISNPLVLASTAYASLIGWEFKLNQLPNIAEYQSLFDQYMINAVKVTFFPASNIAFDATAVTTTIGVPRILMAIDRTDAATPAVENTVREYTKSQRKYMNRECSIYIKKPLTVGLVYNTLATSTFSTNERMWLSLAGAASAPHFGLKTAIVVESQGTTDAEVKVDWEVTYYFQCRNSR